MKNLVAIFENSEKWPRLKFNGPVSAEEINKVRTKFSLYTFTPENPQESLRGEFSILTSRANCRDIVQMVSSILPEYEIKYNSI